MYFGEWAAFFSGELLETAHTRAAKTHEANMRCATAIFESCVSGSRELVDLTADAIEAVSSSASSSSAFGSRLARGFRENGICSSQPRCTRSFGCSGEC